MKRKKKEGLIEWIRAYLPRFNFTLFLKKPVFFVRLAYHLLQAKLFGKHQILGMDFSISPVCNLKCEHCYTTSFGTQDTTLNKPFLSLKQMKQIIRKCLDYGVITFSFQGGEPLMYKELSSLIKAARPRRSFIQIITNGTLANKKLLSDLKKAGLDGVCVSIDSYDPETHDMFRGVKGTFEKAINCLEIAGELGLVRSISTTVWKNTVKSKELIRLFDYATENRIGVQVFIGQPAGNWKNKKEVLLNQEEINWLDEIYSKNRNVKRDLFNNFTFTGCPAFKTSIYITPEGDVIPCPFIHVSFGNLLTDSLGTIVKRARKFPFFSKFEHAPICLSAEDPEFIEKYLARTFEPGTRLPVSYLDVFENRNTRDE